MGAKNNKNSNNLSLRFREKMASTWGLLLSGLSILGVGFTAGIYIAGILNNLKQNDEDMIVKQEKFNLQCEYEAKLHELRERIYSLEKENLKYGREEK
ncbi:hypothetical protein [Bacteroides fragilis]|uniref:hypothetical protein n=1 Tax=Bacteroides fragilis TaxID=817 RepID=UPI00202FA49B|nr:hypothetical protein [Bacteroides fragilis]MCM0219732.1 hypothetical protein [Bacteroides fragilis]MCM0265533.1 hypothetical protein [Bacteroides fragilis]